MTYRIGSLCSGYEGLGMAVAEVLGGELAFVADIDPGACKILAHRFPGVPNLGDISAVSWVSWAAIGRPDVLTAGFPCQDVSCAGGRAGLREGNRTGVWAHVARAISELRPPLVVLENVRGLLSAGADSDVEWCAWCLGEAGNEHPLRALGAVLGDLSGLGYDARWQVVSAADAGAPHRRERVFICAWPAADADGGRLQDDPQLDGAAQWRSRPLGRHPDGHPAADSAGHEPGGHVAIAGVDRGDTGGGPRPGDWRATEDTDRPTRGERRQPAPGQAPGGRARADAGRPGRAHPAADADRGGRQGPESAGPGPGREAAAAVGRRPADEPGPAAADACSEGREGAGHAGTPRGGVAPAGLPADPDGSGRRAEPGQQRGLRAAELLAGDSPRGPSAPDADGGGRRPSEPDDAPRESFTDWGAYATAIARWEHVTGRPAPRPTEPGRTGERLSPAFVEWMMGLPVGWVTDVPGLSRNAQLKALGNGVVPQQAALALRSLLADALQAAAA